ncbi:unnamed protein product [Trichogramma brassicae]|uniref:Uncharacterized protein n=1 Tax=Trichogramma brassicae TaxID=86971 RepID=A0A6H5IPZ6_9HYME|nr:unnamed protein product [Trichogramma brassicae]
MRFHCEPTSRASNSRPANLNFRRAALRVPRSEKRQLDCTAAAPRELILRAYKANDQLILSLGQCVSHPSDIFPISASSSCDRQAASTRIRGLLCLPISDSPISNSSNSFMRLCVLAMLMRCIRGKKLEPAKPYRPTDRDNYRSMRAHSRARAQLASAPQRLSSLLKDPDKISELYIPSRSIPLGFSGSQSWNMIFQILFCFPRPTEIRSDVKLSFSSSAFRSSNSSIASSNSFKQLLISVSQEKVEKEVEEDAGRCRRVDKRPRVGVEEEAQEEEEEEEEKRQKQSHRIEVGCSDGGDRASERGREPAEGGRFHALDPTEVQARTSSKRESLRARAGEWIVDAFMWRFGGCILRIFSSGVAPPLGRLSSASWRCRCRQSSSLAI